MTRTISLALIVSAALCAHGCSSKTSVTATASATASATGAGGSGAASSSASAGGSEPRVCVFDDPKSTFDGSCTFGP